MIVGTDGNHKRDVTAHVVEQRKIRLYRMNQIVGEHCDKMG